MPSINRQTSKESISHSGVRGLDARTERLTEESFADVLSKVEQFLRVNPWVAVAGAAVTSGILEALSDKRALRRPSSRAAVRDWVDDAYATLPTKKQFRSVAKSAGLPTTLRQLGDLFTFTDD